MIKKFYLLILGLPEFLLGHAQNFQPASIIDQRGDTLKGEIGFKRWDRNPSKISFRSGGDSQAKSFSPRDTQSFSGASEHYESAIVDVDTSPYKTNDLTQSPRPEYVRDTVFLQAIFRGKKSISKFGADVKYEVTNGVSAFPDLNSYTYRFDFLLKYKFSKSNP